MLLMLGIHRQQPCLGDDFCGGIFIFMASSFPIILKSTSRDDEP